MKFKVHQTSTQQHVQALLCHGLCFTLQQQLCLAAYVPAVSFVVARLGFFRLAISAVMSGLAMEILLRSLSAAGSITVCCFCKCIQPTACWQAMYGLRQCSMLNNCCNLLTVQCFYDLKTAAIDNMRDSQVCMIGSSLLQGCSMLPICQLRGLKCMRANRKT